MIKKYRIKKGYTQEQLAELLGISWRHVQRLENNSSNIKLDTLQKLIKILDISDDDILNFIKNYNTITKKKNDKTHNQKCT